MFYFSFGTTLYFSWSFSSFRFLVVLLPSDISTQVLCFFPYNNGKMATKKIYFCQAKRKKYIEMIMFSEQVCRKETIISFWPLLLLKPAVSYLLLRSETFLLCNLFTFISFWGGGVTWHGFYIIFCSISLHKKILFCSFHLFDIMIYFFVKMQILQLDIFVN